MAPRTKFNIHKLFCTLNHAEELAEEIAREIRDGPPTDDGSTQVVFLLKITPPECSAAFVAEVRYQARLLCPGVDLSVVVKGLPVNVRRSGLGPEGGDAAAGVGGGGAAGGAEGNGADAETEVKEEAQEEGDEEGQMSEGEAEVKQESGADDEGMLADESTAVKKEDLD